MVKLEDLKYVTEIKGNKLYFDKDKVAPYKRKITGTYLASLSESNAYQTPDDAMLSRLGIYTPKIDEFYTNRGYALEPLVVKYIEDNEKYVSIKIQRWNPKDINYDNFLNVQNFGGLLDGFINNESERAVVEIKTTNYSKKSIDEWESGNIPYNYKMQAGLYAYLTQADNIYFGVCFCNDYFNNKIHQNEEIDYDELTSYNTKIYKVPFDEEYKKEVEEKMSVALKNYEQIFARGYIDLSKLGYQNKKEFKKIMENNSLEK